MTVGEWLACREPAPPVALREHLVDLLRGVIDRDAADIAELFLLAAEQLVADLIRRDCTTRESALDLLAADALVTYAFESAAGQTANLAPRARDAMRRIALLGAADRERVKA